MIRLFLSRLIPPLPIFADCGKTAYCSKKTTKQSSLKLLNMHHTWLE